MKQKRQGTVTYLRDSKQFTEVYFVTCPNILNLDQPILTNSTHFHVARYSRNIFYDARIRYQLAIIAEGNTVKNVQENNNCTSY